MHARPDRPADARAAPAQHDAPDVSPSPSPREPVQRWRLEVTRDAIEPEAQRGLQRAWEDALLASGLPVAGLDADPPRPRFAVAAPLTAAYRGEAELVDLWLAERRPAWAVREALRDAVPAGFALREAYDVWLGEPALPGQVVASVYRADLRSPAPGGAAIREAVRGLVTAAALPRVRRKGDRAVEYDLRPFIVALEVADPGDGGTTTLRMTLRHDPERGVGRPEEVTAALAERLGADLGQVDVVRERLVLATDEAVR